jgi:23S rRNA pseudouridine2457 synthase
MEKTNTNRLYYFICYKPYQVLCQFSPEPGKLVLADVLPGLPKDVYPAGRLDYDSEGLLLLTNDGHFIKQLLEPRYKHKRTYLVQVEGNITDEALAQLASGITISVNGKKYTTLPAQAERCTAEPKLPPRNPPIRVRKLIPTSWIRLTLTEGKNRQVRKMTAATGFPTLRLVRYSIENITIEQLQPGECRLLHAHELSALSKIFSANKR